MNILKDSVVLGEATSKRHDHLGRTGGQDFAFDSVAACSHPQPRLRNALDTYRMRRVQRYEQIL